MTLVRKQSLNDKASRKPACSPTQPADTHLASSLQFPVGPRWPCSTNGSYWLFIWNSNLSAIPLAIPRYVSWLCVCFVSLVLKPRSGRALHTFGRGGNSVGKALGRAVSKLTRPGVVPGQSQQSFWQVTDRQTNHRYDDSRGAAWQRSNLGAQLVTVSPCNCRFVLFTSLKWRQWKYQVTSVCLGHYGLPVSFN